jgi:hypothetical protein
MVATSLTCSSMNHCMKRSEAKSDPSRAALSRASHLVGAPEQRGVPARRISTPVAVNRSSICEGRPVNVGRVARPSLRRVVRFRLGWVS